MEQLLLESDLDRASSWFNHLLSIAVDEADLLYLSAILDGTVVLPAFADVAGSPLAGRQGFVPAIRCQTQTGT